MMAGTALKTKILNRLLMFIVMTLPAWLGVDFINAVDSLGPLSLKLSVKATKNPNLETKARHQPAMSGPCRRAIA